MFMYMHIYCSVDLVTFAIKKFPAMILGAENQKTQNDSIKYWHNVFGLCLIFIISPWRRKRNAKIYMMNNHPGEIFQTSDKCRHFIGYILYINFHTLTIPSSVVSLVFKILGVWVTERECSRTDSCSSRVQLTPSPGSGTHQFSAYQA